MSGRQEANAFKQGEVREDVLEREVLGERGAADPDRHAGVGEDRLHLGAEEEALPVREVVQRLCAEAVAREEEHLVPPVPDGEREVAVQPLDARLPPGFVRVDEHLGVAARAEREPERFELDAQLGEVVDLPVIDRDRIRPPSRHRLVSGHGDVDDGQTPAAEADGAVGVLAGIVRPAMHERGGHAADALRRYRLAVEVRRSRDSAHVSRVPPAP
jgi:hypothetical protein